MRPNKCTPPREIAVASTTTWKTKRAVSLNRRPTVFLLLLFLACAPNEQSAHTDDLGRPVALTARVSRVVSLAPNLTEMLLALRVGERGVGTGHFSNFPPRAK